ncbi:hypothetical protein [Raoultella ornithinolytica]|uniref:hypothetical protein n=1 Tax=Raoultella ornithinolytica TaxID=54291 RepID=UPI0015DC4E12|nr:hypothetical protein [Raoultella ornithinolytica]MBK2608123.1 hypothetical protein [Raoultella ornithinolytica]QLK15264.1 hypothetical protein GPJ65_05995 [Raoultella ornithinolytica]
MQNKIETILSILTVLGTLGSALAAFLAIKQTIKQRKNSVTPQLVINNFQFLTREVYDDCYSLFPMDIELSIKNKPQIINAGSGVALNTSIKIEYDFIPTMNFFALSQGEINKKYRFEYTDNSENKDQKVKFTIGGNHTSLSKEAEMNINLGYIPPHTNDSHTIKLNLLTFFIEVFVNKYLFELKLNNQSLEYINGPQFIVSYSDIDGNHYKTLYKSKIFFNINSKSESKISFKGMLEFQVEKSNRIQRGLQRIRKSYADFLSEHDFNKNK